MRNVPEKLMDKAEHPKRGPELCGHGNSKEKAFTEKGRCVSRCRISLCEHRGAVPFWGR